MVAISQIPRLTSDGLGRDGDLADELLGRWLSLRPSKPFGTCIDGQSNVGRLASYRSLTAARGLTHGSWLERASGCLPRIWSAAFSPVMIEGPFKLP